MRSGPRAVCAAAGEQKASAASSASAKAGRFDVFMVLEKMMGLAGPFRKVRIGIRGQNSKRPCEHGLERERRNLTNFDGAICLIDV